MSTSMAAGVEDFSGFFLIFYFHGPQKILLEVFTYVQLQYIFTENSQPLSEMMLKYITFVRWHVDFQLYSKCKKFHCTVLVVIRHYSTYIHCVHTYFYDLNVMLDYI